MQAQSASTTASEQAGYFPVPGAHLYTVIHEVEDPLARVLLVGPFASERYFAYHSWVRWARHLAARRIEVLRYDHRGVGESTGLFEEMSFDHWNQDLRILSGWFANRSPDVPLVMHGMELGAMFAAKAFHEGAGDALLMWAPPSNANHVLRSTLLRWSGLEQLYESPENRKTASEYIRQLEQGDSIEVQGYLWSSRLWRESLEFDYPAELADESSFEDKYKRPVRRVRFGKGSNQLAMPYLRFDEVKDLAPLYAENLEWIAGSLNLPRGEWR